MGPYRAAAESVGGASEANKGSQTAEMWFAAVVLVPASLARVIAAVVRHETFGVEATLALFVSLAAVYAVAAKGVRVAAGIVRRVRHFPRG